VIARTDSGNARNVLGVPRSLTCKWEEIPLKHHRQEAKAWSDTVWLQPDPETAIATLWDRGMWMLELTHVMPLTQNS
jgi:hypothetical protein